MLKYLGEFKKTGNNRLYKCECSFCGKIVYVKKFRIKEQKSCGCYRRNHINLKNKRINYITYTGEESKNKFRSIIYKGICDCGNEVWSTSKDYKDKKSCGCELAYIDRPKRYKGKKGKHIHYAILVKCRSGAKVRNIPFEISLDDLDQQFEKQNGLCFYTGMELTLCDQSIDYYRNRKDYNLSVDRIDSNLGYTKDNICLCLKEINYMKQKLSKERFIELCKKVAEYN